MAPDTRLHLCFVAVAEELSFTKAAARLNVAQPWLSARVRQLERRLGVELFVRTTRKVEITPAGQVLLPRAQAIRNAIAEFDDVARELSGAPAVLRIGAPPYVGQIPAARDLIDAFRRTHPQTPLDLEVGWSRVLLARLAAGELDASFTLGAEHGPELEEFVLENLFLELEMDADDPLCDGELTPQALAGRRILVPARPPNPNLFELLYSEIRDSGAILIEESTLWSGDALRPADSDGLLVSRISTPGRLRRSRHGRIRRRVDGVASVPFKLVRRKSGRRGPTELIFELARGAALVCAPDPA
ncbi:MAG: LysR family transcriptional regulator [Phenylobacterium sp.]|nr:LysR family transcriptional regulator [Phenylobacterium sp.]